MYIHEGMTKTHRRPFAHIHACVPKHVLTCRKTCIHWHTHAYTYLHANIRAAVFTNKHACTCTCAYTYIRTFVAYVQLRVRIVCISVNIHTFTYVHMHMYVHTHAQVAYVCMLLPCLQKPLCVYRSRYKHRYRYGGLQNSGAQI